MRPTLGARTANEREREREKTSIGNNSGSMKHTVINVACSMYFLLCRIELSDRHLCQVAGSDHA